MVQQAASAFPGWRDLGSAQRCDILKQTLNLLLERKEEFARLISSEMGRPYIEAMVTEVEATCDLLKYYANKGRTMLADRWVPLGHPFFKRRSSRFHYEPLGVLGIIAPWNWPLLIPMGCIVPALLAGNAVVFKHSELTPLIAEKIQQLLIDAGVPAAVMQVVQGEGDQGKALVESSVTKIFFTGSTDVGKKVMLSASRKLKSSVLELGGSDPAIVCDDAELDITASGIVWGAFNNCGQNCNSIERVFVHDSVADDFISKLVSKTELLRIGNGMEPDVDMGPLASEAQFKKIKSIIARELKNGGKLLCGGKPFAADEKGFYFEPTIILRDGSMPQPPDLEFFGPLMCVTRVKSDELAINAANASSFGLTASVWTSSKKRGMEIACRLETGTVMINDHEVSFGLPEADWTGVKESGIGWVHGKKGLEEMVNIKYINYEPQFKMQKFWWFPYSELMVTAINSAMVFLFAPTWSRRLKEMFPTLRHFWKYLVLNRKRKNKL